MGFVGLLDAANFKERAQGFTEGLAGTNITLVDTKGDGIDQTRAKATSPTCWRPTPTSTAWSASTPTTRLASMRR